MIYWLSSKRMTFVCEVSERGFVTHGPPIIKRFFGQPFDNLLQWMKTQEGFKYKQLETSNNG